MKTFYFVRHGESETNVKRVFDGPEPPLTKRGEQQSRFLAKRFKTIPLNGIAASPYVRARQTAELLNEELMLPTQFSELLRERVYPSRLLGLPPENTERQHIVRALHEADKQGAPCEDAESVTDMKQRGMQALDFLRDLPFSNAVVVTHGAFLRMLAALILLGDNLTPREYVTISLVFATKNTGITLVTQGKENPSGGWRMFAWNDHAHLGDVD